jgi:hypothetical protein
MLTKISDSLLIDLSEVVSAHLTPGDTISSVAGESINCIVTTKNGTLAISKDAEMTFKKLTEKLALGRDGASVPPSG